MPKFETHENIDFYDYIKFCYMKNIKFYKPKSNNLKNKYLNDIIVNCSYMINQFKIEYSFDEIYNLDLRNELKDYERFNELFKDNKTSAETMYYLIYCLKYNVLNDDIKNITYNLYYLQMTEVIEIVQIISNKHLSIES